jgi:hypothetical protein
VYILTKISNLTIFTILTFLEEILHRSREKNYFLYLPVIFGYFSAVSCDFRPLLPKLLLDTSKLVPKILVRVLKYTKDY